MQYRFPCNNCDSQLIVQAKDAGRELPCPSCRTIQKIPTLGTIRQLEPVSDSKAIKEKKWSLLQGASFGIGMIALVAAIIGFTVYVPEYNQSTAEIERLKTEVFNGELPDYTNPKPVEELFAKMPANQLWEEWRQALKSDTDHWAPSKLRTLLDAQQDSQKAIYGFAGLAAFGIIGMISSFFLP